MRMTQALKDFSQLKEQQSFETGRLIEYGKNRKAKGVKTVQVDKGIWSTLVLLFLSLLSIFFK